MTTRAFDRFRVVGLPALISLPAANRVHERCFLLSVPLSIDSDIVWHRDG